MRKFRRVPAGAFVLCILAASLTRAANWPQWRGSAGTGVSTETRLPADWSSEKNIRWKTPIPGRGHSSPIVWGNRIFLTTDIEEEVVPGGEGGQTHHARDRFQAPRQRRRRPQAHPQAYLPGP